MKLITAYVHHNRSSGVIEALAAAGYRHIAVLDVRGSLPALTAAEQQFSTNNARLTTAEARLELVCENSDVQKVTDLIRDHGHAGTGISGVICVSPVDQLILVGDSL